MFKFLYYYFTSCFANKNVKKGLLEDPEDMEIHELYSPAGFVQPDADL